MSKPAPGLSPNVFPVENPLDYFSVRIPQTTDGVFQASYHSGHRRKFLPILIVADVLSSISGTDFPYNATFY